MMKPALSIGHIIHQVAKFYGIDPVLMTSPRRARVLARPRQVAMWLCAELLPEASLPTIAARLKRDHTTVLYGIRTIATMRRSDPAIATATDALRGALAAETSPPPADLALAAEAAAGVLGNFQHALVALVHRDPAGALVLFRRWHAEMREVLP